MPEELADDHYDSVTGTWNLDADLLKAINDDLQRLVNCVPKSGIIMIFLALNCDLFLEL